MKNENGTRYNEFKLWEDTKNQPYDYKEKGLVNHILSNKIYNTTNPILKFIL